MAFTPWKFKKISYFGPSKISVIAIISFHHILYSILLKSYEHLSILSYKIFLIVFLDYWRASWSFAEFAYLSVNLLTPHFITKIHIQGSNSYFIKRFKILYSLDGYQWEYYTENKDDPNSAREFEGNHGGYDISIAYMKYPFIVSHSMN